MSHDFTIRARKVMALAAMKYILPSIGAIAGLFVFRLIGGGPWPYLGAFLGVLAGLGLDVALPRRPRETLDGSKKPDPKELLRDREEESFSSWPLPRLKDLKEKLVESGLVYQFDERNSSCSVHSIWQELSDSDKVTFCRFGYRYCLKTVASDDKGHFCVHANAVGAADPADEHYIYLTPWGLVSTENPLPAQSSGRVITVVDGDLFGKPKTHHQDIKSLIAGLPRTEGQIITLYYYEGKTIKEIGDTFDISEAEVSKMHASALDRLKKKLDDRRKDGGEESSD